MSLQIIDVENLADKTEKEYIRIKANASVNLSNYIVVDNTYKDGQLTNIHRHFFRMPDINVRRDDEIIIYTGKGTNSYKIIMRKATGTAFMVHSLYSGSDAFVWNNDGDRAQIFRIEQVAIKQVPSGKE